MSISDMGGNSNVNKSVFLNNNPHQQTAQWDDFNQFINEQKIEQPLCGGSSLLTTSIQGGSNDHINRIEAFLNKEENAGAQIQSTSTLISPIL